MNKTIFAIATIGLLLLSSLIAIPVSSEDTNKTKNIKSLIFPDNYYIEGFNYTHQTEGYFCYLTCYYMVFNYLGINTSIDEILYYYGMGYSLYYPSEEDKNLTKRIPVIGRAISRNQLVADMLGVKQKIWEPVPVGNEEEIWEPYWERIKENVSNDVPVITVIDPLSLPSLRNQFLTPDIIWNKLGEGVHYIVITGYNEINKTVCFQDPNAGHYGSDSFGDHAWMSIEQLKTACRKEKHPDAKYLVITWDKNGERIPKLDAFEYVHKINIEKLKGNHTAYAISGLNVTERPNGLFGIKATERLKKDFEKGVDNRIQTISLYKKYGKLGFYFRYIHFMQKICKIILPNRPSLFDIFDVSKMSNFEHIAIEKLHMANYLTEISEFSEICDYEADLFIQESQNWSILANCYSEFMKKGIFMSLPQAILIMNQMEETMNNIIVVEQAIIDRACD